VTIREARADDAAALVGLLEELGYPSSAGQIAARLRRLAADDASRVFVATIDGETAGLAAVHVTAAVEHDAPTCLLIAMVVAERHQRRGVGSALVARAEQEARALGCGRVVLGSAERRRDAHAFYERLGYERTGRRYAKAI
jgi:GNAT superfamily N-acetyltransferase